MMNSNIKPIGVVSATLLDEFGNVKQKEVSHNTIVNSGCNLIASLLSGVDIMDRPSHMAVGTNSNETSPIMTTLGAEVANSRTAFDTGFPTRTDSQIIYTTTFNPTVGSGILREVGIFNCGSPGSGCVLTPTIEGGKIISVAVTSGGTGYSAGDAITVTDTAGSGCVLSHTVDANGTVTAVTVVEQGSGYTNAATVSIVGGGTMMNRVVFPTITKEPNDTLIVQWAVTIS